MGKVATWLTAAGVAIAVLAMGISLDVLLALPFLFTALAGAGALVYLVGTFAQSTPLFGRAVRPRVDSRHFALTFDDGPDPATTPAISRLLAQRGHQATFFILGMHGRAHPQVLATIIADGHELGNHGDDHRLLAFSSPRVVRAQLEATEAAIVAATGERPVPLFRPPHGVRSPWLARTARGLGYALCGWSGSAFDTRNPGPQAIAERICRRLRAGAILLLHDADGSGAADSRQQTVEALEPILDEAERRGMHSVRLSSLLDPVLFEVQAGTERR